MKMRSIQVIVSKTNVRRRQEKSVPKISIQAGEAVADGTRTCLGPRTML